MPGRASAITVLGPVDAEQMGVTLAHEHLLIDFVDPSMAASTNATDQRLAHQLVGPDNLWWVRQYWGLSPDNLRLDDEQTAAAEALRFRSAGGQTIIDATSRGLGRNPPALVRLAQRTGLHIIMGSGYYRAPWHPKELATTSEAQIVDEILADLSQGVADTGIRSGLIGEIGLSWPVHEVEFRVLKAAVRAQSKSGAAMLVHPGRNDREPRDDEALRALLDIVRLVDECGADASKLILAHVERRLYRHQDVLRLAKSGCYLSFDLFGEQTSFDPLAPVFPFPSDAERLATVRALADAGHLHQVLISHDICQKHRLTRFGGHGLDHIPRVVISQMRALGFAESEIEALLVANPRHAFSQTL